MSLKTYFLLLMSTVLLHTLTAQTDTIYYAAKFEKTKNPSLATFYTVISKRHNIETHTEYYLSGKKRSYCMYKKLPHVIKNELVVVGFTAKEKGASYSNDKGSPMLVDSIMAKHGSFIEWFETGDLKASGTYFAGKLQGELITFHENQKYKRKDDYHLDTLVSGHCFDSLGNEIAHFHYYTPPEYIEGEKALYKFLGQNVKYPASAREKYEQGTVYVDFVVDQNGKLRNVNANSKANKKIVSELIVESVRTVSALPSWKPAMIDGEKVAQYYTLPIIFKMD
jgi:TonB family protein